MDCFDNVYNNWYFNMKRVLMMAVVIFISGLTVFLIISTIKIEHKRNAAKERIKTLPVFSLRTISDTMFRSDNITEGPVLVLFFHPECEHCQYHIESLFNNKVFIQGVIILLISSSEKEGIIKFLKEHNLLDHPELIALIDEAYSFKDWFGTDLIPATFIYNKKLKLVRYFQGEVKPETIRKYLRQND